MVRTRSSAPADRVSSPQQIRFPARRRRIRREISESSKELLRQSTLTQINYVSSGMTSEQLDAELDEFEKEEKARKSKRRRTYGGETSSTPIHHTQTLTQIDFITNLERMDGDEDTVIRESPEARGCSVSGDRIPVQQRYDTQETDEGISRTYSASPAAPQSTPLIPPPETPSKRRLLEIPSSQSPATPFSLRCTRSESRSPLKEKSANAILTDKLPDMKLSPHKLPKLEIEDTFEWENEESQFSRVPTSPKRFSPKSVRFTMRPNSVVPSTPIANQKLKPRSSPVMMPSTVTKTEILDSDTEDDEEPDTCYGNFGIDTQVQAAQLFSTPAGGSSTLEATELAASLPTYDSDPQEFLVTQPTQAEESQRLSRQEVMALAERTPRSDVIISIYPGHICSIANGSKNHEFRDWPIPSQVVRVWFYETKPSSCMRFMAVISRAKRPGDIADLHGIGNKEFNACAKPNRRAYEILELYQLAKPMPLKELVRNEVLRSAPQKFTYLLPATLDDLMSRLEKRVLPASSVEEEQASSDSQEAHAQLQSTIQQFTPMRNNHRRPRSSQATTVDLSQSEPPSEAVSAQLVPDSPVVLVPESQDFPTRRSMSDERESAVPFSFGSSQLLTKSQMLPASLIEDSGPLYRLYVADSEEEDDEDANLL